MKDKGETLQAYPAMTIRHILTVLILLCGSSTGARGETCRWEPSALSMIEKFQGLVRFLNTTQGRIEVSIRIAQNGDPEEVSVDIEDNIIQSVISEEIKEWKFRLVNCVDGQHPESPIAPFYIDYSVDGGCPTADDRTCKTKFQLFLPDRMLIRTQHSIAIAF